MCVNAWLTCCSLQGDLSDLGRVLMQGSFSVWISHKKGPTRVKELARFKPMQRHLFLHEHALLFCKRREEHGENADKTPSYSFKHCLKVRRTSCCEHIYNPRNPWLASHVHASLSVSLFAYPFHVFKMLFYCISQDVIGYELYL